VIHSLLVLQNPWQKLQTVENKGDPDMPEPAAEGDIQTEQCFDYFYSFGIGAVTGNYL